MPFPLPDAILQVRGLSFAYPDQPPLVTGLSLDLPPGVSLLDGDIGSGKSTLLKVLAGDLSGSGELMLQGQRFSDNPAAYRRLRCWFNPRDPAFDALTPAGLKDALRQQHPELDDAAWQRHLVGFDLLQHQAKPLYALSTGSRQKAALAVALSSGCALTLLDEPTHGLDAPSLAYLAEVLIQAATEARRALLMVCSRPLDGVPLAATITLPGPECQA